MFQTYVKKLEELLNKKATVVLIGSRARGNSISYGDYNIIVFTNMEEE